MPENTGTLSIADQRHRWSIEDEIVAYALFCITPSSKINLSNKTIKQIAEMQKIGLKSFVLKMRNFNYAYTEELAQMGIGTAYGCHSVSKQARAVYNEFKNNWSELSREAERITGLTIFRFSPIQGVFIDGRPVSTS